MPRIPLSEEGYGFTPLQGSKPDASATAALDREAKKLLAEIDVLDRRGALDDRDRAELAAAVEARRKGEIVAKAFETMAEASVELTSLLSKGKS